MIDPPAHRAVPDPEFADRLERLLLQRLTGTAEAPNDTTGPTASHRGSGRRGVGPTRQQIILGVAAASLLVAGVAVWRDDGSTVDVATSVADPQGPLGDRWFAFAAGPFGEADIHLVRDGEEPRRVDLPDSEVYHEACPAFAPQPASAGADTQRLMIGRATRDDAELVIVELEADGFVSPSLRIPLDGLGGVPCALWSPDGNWAALAGGGDVWVVDTNNGEVRRLPGYHPTDLEWRPGTDELAITGERAELEDRPTDAPVVIYTVSTGEVRSLGAAHASHITWSPDGSTLALTHGEDQRDSGIWLIDADGTDERQLTEHLGQVLHGTGIAWSPNGDVIAYQRCDHPDCNGERHDIVLVTAITGEPDNPIGTETVLAAPRTETTSASTPWKPYNLIWSPDGTYLLAFAWGSVEGAVIAVPVDPGRSPVVIDDDLGAAIGTDDLGVYDGTPWIPLQPWSEP